MHFEADGSGQHRTGGSSKDAPAKRESESPDNALRPMLFVHIPKTAGTSLRHGVADFLGKERLVLDYGPNQAATSHLVKRWCYQDPEPEKFRVAFDTKGKKFLSGHIRLSDYVGGFDLDNVAVFLRDPIQRVVSEYQHFVRHYGYKRSLEEFAQTEAFQNKQARALAGVPIERLGLVGLAEWYDESLARLNAHFGWKIPSRNVNMGRSQLSEDYQLDRATRRLIERNNPLDLALYASAMENFKKRDRSQTRPATAPATGSCRLGPKHAIQGWACQISGERPTIVDVEVNGEKVGAVTADRFRPDIRRRGLKRSGCAGFSFHLPSLSPGDEIRCIETDGRTELNNSPLRVPAAR